MTKVRVTVRARNAVFGAAIAVITAAGQPATAQAPPGKPVDGRVEVSAQDFKPVFLDQRLIYPGTSVSLGVEPRVDVMRYMYEERHCWSKWFGGIWCKWVETSRGSGLPVAQTPLVLRLASNGAPAAAGVVSPVQAASRLDPELHLPEGQYSFTLPLSAAAMQQGAFTQGYRLEGRLAPRHGPGANDTVRQPCSPHFNGQYCSQGQFVVTVQEVDVTERQAQLEKFLEVRRSYAEVSSPNTIDFFLRNEIQNGIVRPATARLAAIGQLLLEHTRTHYAGGQLTNPDRGRILELAANVAPTNPHIRNELVAFQIDTGDLATASGLSAQVLKDFQAKEEAGTITVDELRAYAKALRNAGAIHLGETQAVVLADIERAAGAYAKAIDIWKRYLDKATVDRRALAPELAQAYLDHARVLSLLKTPATLERAAESLRDARSLVPRSRQGAVAATTLAGDRLLSIDVPADVGSVPGVKTSMRFLPPGYDRIVHADAVAGVVLIEGRRVDHRGYARLRQGTVERLVGAGAAPLRDASLFGGGVVGLDSQGRLLRLGDTVEQLGGSQTKAFGAAADAQVLAWVEADRPGILQIKVAQTALETDVGAGDVRSVAVSRDGRRVAVLQDVDTARTLKLFAIDPAAPATPSAPVSVELGNLVIDDRTPLLWMASSEHLLVRGQGDIVLVTPAGEARHVRAGPIFAVTGRLTALPGERLAALKVENGLVTNLAIVDVAALFSAGKPLDQSAPNAVALHMIKLQGAIPAEDLTVGGMACADGGCDLQLHARRFAGLLRVYAPNGDARGQRTVPSAVAVSTLQLLPGGNVITHEDAAAGTAHVLDVRMGAAAMPIAAAVGGQVEIIPLAGTAPGAEPLYFAVETDPKGFVARVSTYQGPAQLVAPAALPSGTWRLLREPASPASREQTRIRLLEVVSPPVPPPVDPAAPALSAAEAYKALAPVPVRLLTVSPQGAIDVRTLQLRSPHQVVTIVDDIAIELKRDKLAWASPSGALTFFDLDTCSEVFCQTAEFLVPADGALLVWREVVLPSGRQLELKHWTAASGQLTETTSFCPTCREADPSRAGLYGPVLGAPFALAPGNTALLAPLGQQVGVAGLPGGGWSQQISSGRPVAVHDGSAVIQRDAATFEVWALKE
jgi:hypothetical protein